MFDQLKKRFEARHLSRRVAGNTAWQLVDKVLRLIMGLVVGVWVARYLGPDSFGLLSYSIAFVALFAAIADGGMQTVVVRELVQRQQDRATIMRSALALRVAGALVAITFSVVSIRLLRPNDDGALLMIAIVSLSLLPQSWDIIDYEYQSRLRSRPIALIRATSFCLFALLKLSMIFMRAKLVWFAWAVAGEAALSALIMNMLPHARLSLGSEAKLSWPEIRYLVQTCWPLTVAGLSIMLYMRIDQVMLGQMLGDGAVGTFSAAVRISESWYFIPIAVMSSIAPALIVTMQQSEQRYRKKLLSVTRVLGWLAVLVALVFSIFAHKLIVFLYGQSYEAAGPVLVIHAWAGVFVSLGVAAGPWFVNGGLLRLRMAQTVAGAAINMIMNLFMIPHFGVAGAACSTLVSYGVSAFFFNALSIRTRPMFFIQANALLFR